jgi:cell division protein FtsL
MTTASDSAREVVLPAVRWLALLPSWILLAMILLATSAVCATVILKAKAEFQASATQRQKMMAEIESLGRANRSLELEIRRLTTDSNTIEFAARERLGMVMPSDIVVPIESMSSTSDLRTLSFVR